ncbi:unnamed protein product, partial [Allacma fusca]
MNKSRVYLAANCAQQLIKA